MSRLSVVHNLSSFHTMRLSNWDLFDWVPPPSLLELAVWRREGCITVTDGASLPCKYCSTLWSKIWLSHVKCIAANSGRFNYNNLFPDLSSEKRWEEENCWKFERMVSYHFESWSIFCHSACSACPACPSCSVCNLRPFFCCQESHWPQCQALIAKVWMQIPSTGSFGDFEMKTGCSAVMPTLRWITFHTGFETEGWERLSHIWPWGSSAFVLALNCLNVPAPTSYFLAEDCEAFPVCTSMSSRCWKRMETPSWSRPGMPG